MSGGKDAHELTAAWQRWPQLRAVQQGRVHVVDTDVFERPTPRLLDGLEILAGGRSPLRRDSLILGGVMINAFFGAMIMFLISLSQDARMRSILFWLMGDLSMISPQHLPVLLMVLPGMAVIFELARPMNLLLMGRDTAASMGGNVRLVTLALLVFTSLMVSVAVSQSGLIGFGNVNVAGQRPFSGDPARY
ncbi:iron chelate uptake ABC transporter family permease subunit [Desulfonatronospira sp.]|uniref:iron chelate uptake ABC transporter family permease subunit n=1 Tax=Desulfonatronospira sp. TaxID=1962951 RepID=UPI0025B92691|nr:iron chelate uptake ABC transporter family permease subunit [Desulfonatronospira sp.]